MYPDDAGITFLNETALQAVTPKTGQAEPQVCSTCQPGQKMIHLPRPEEVTTDPALLSDVLDHRRSLRIYTNEPLCRWELSLLLYYTQGVCKDEPDARLRNVPSAGAIHPFETFLVINRVEKIESGLYRYLPLDHALVRESCTPGENQKIAETCKNPQLVVSSAVTFIWTAHPERMTWKFGARGWRYLFIEAGHVCQNLYLVAGSIGCGVCAIGSYHDDELNCLLGIDGRSEFCIYLASVGKRKE